MEHITDEQIERFLSGLCTKEEAEKVGAYLKAHPENAYLLQEYDRTDERTPLPEGYSEEMLRVIMEKTGDNRSRTTWIGPVWKWAAACILLAAGAWYGEKWIHQPGAQASAGQNKELAAVAWITRNNNGKSKLPVVLPDKSTVILGPGSNIQYRSDFGHYATRDVNVSGEAFFIVARNRQMPFVVHSEGISTTALGTSFEVLADSSRDKICVQLFTGKVAVSLAGKVSASALQYYYLSPGQELVFEKKSKRASVDQFNIRHNGHITLPEIKQAGLDNWFMFNNQDLGAVFDQLSAIYNVNIQYPEKYVNSMYLIGKLDKKDSLEEILDDIALLNHLSITRRNGGYVIQKLS
jgi:transmembrane sensor